MGGEYVKTMGVVDNFFNQELDKTLSQRVQVTWLAMRRQIAVGMSRGRSFVASLGSLWRQNKYRLVR